MLRAAGRVSLPSSGEGGYDHADVHQKTGKVYVGHTGNGSVEVFDGREMKRLGAIPGCKEASGVLCDQAGGLVFAASRGEGKLLVIDSDSDKVARVIPTGPKPNGIAWDFKRKQVLVADVGDNRARLLDPHSGNFIGETLLPGRPRWATYVPRLDSFLINIRDPPEVAIIDAATMAGKEHRRISAQGPHGLELSEDSRIAYVACDSSSLVPMDLDSGEERGSVTLSGAPDVLWANHSKGLLYCAIGNPGVIDVIDTRKYGVVERLSTEEGAHTLTFDPERQRLYAFLPKSQSAVAYVY